MHDTSKLFTFYVIFYTYFAIVLFYCKSCKRRINKRDYCLFLLTTISMITLALAYSEITSHTKTMYNITHFLVTSFGILGPFLMTSRLGLIGYIFFSIVMLLIWIFEKGCWLSTIQYSVVDDDASGSVNGSSFSGRSEEPPRHFLPKWFHRPYVGESLLAIWILYAMWKCKKV